MSIIYQPRGAAREYADWAVNIYNGCEHGCTYCYVPSVKCVNRDDFHRHISLRKTFFERLEWDCKKWEREGRTAQVLLCFTCDPYMPWEKETLYTAHTIKMLHNHGLSVCVLTKSPSLAVRDLHMYREGDAFATTLTFPSDRHQDSLEWEPLAELPHQRIMGLRAFKDRGIPTWVSLEPVVDASATLDVIYESYPWVDEYRVGKLNYVKNDTDWELFAHDVVSLLERLGKKYVMKDSLKKYLENNDAVS